MIDRRKLHVHFTWAVTLCVTGCGTLPEGGLLPDAIWPAADPATVSIEPSTLVESTFASPFGDAFRLDLQTSDAVSITGRIVSPDAVVAYAIGPVDPGDRLEVKAISLAEGFDPAVALFDDASNWVHLNDNAGAPTAPLDASLIWTADRKIDDCFVVVAASPKSDSTGQYLLTIKRTTLPAAPVKNAQIVYLEFGGQSGVVIGQRAPVDVPPFSGDLIAPEFADATDELMLLVTQRVRNDFAPFGVTVVASHESPPPAALHTSIYFGSYDPGLLGIADNVDVGNATPVQEAIIFVDTFAVFMSQEPTVDEMADALANVASHEIGHLLGLHHTADPHSLMDTTASLRQMMTPQSFLRVLLHPDTFRVGYQDAPQTLAINTGRDPETANIALRGKVAKTRDPWYDEGPQQPAREGLRFGTACPGHQ